MVLVQHPAIKNFAPCCGEHIANPRPLVDVGSRRRRRVCKFDGPPPPVAMHRCNRGTSALFVTSTISQGQYCVITSAIPGEALPTSRRGLRYSVEPTREYGRN